MTTPISQSKPAGNTKSAGKPPNQLYRWFFTLPCGKDHTDPNEPKKVYQLLFPFCKEFYFQLEKGDNTDYYHFQGCFSLKNKEYFNTVKNLIRNDVHLEPCHDWFASKNYCNKSETRVAGPWNHQSTFLKTIKELRPWQKEVVDMIKDPCNDDRSIFWLWEPQGNFGKTCLLKYLVAYHKVTALNNGAFRDIAHAIGNDPRCVVFNLSRVIEGRVNYSAIESIKDGLIFSGKYESCTKIFDSPHVIVFANFEPDYTSMSHDRWIVVNLRSIIE